jgi:hypothetical protein
VTICNLLPNYYTFSQYEVPFYLGYSLKLQMTRKTEGCGPHSIDCFGLSQVPTSITDPGGLSKFGTSTPCMMLHRWRTLLLSLSTYLYTINNRLYSIHGNSVGKNPRPYFACSRKYSMIPGSVTELSCSLKRSQWLCDPHSHLFSGCWRSSPGLRLPNREANHSPPSRTKYKNVWNYFAIYFHAAVH